MPSQHAILAASSAHRWLVCTPSARLEERIPEKGSAAAAEGTVAHAKAEEKLRNYIEGHPRRKVTCPDGEMAEATDAYKNYVIEVFNAAKKKTPDAVLDIERRVDFSKWVPDGFGTADAVIIADDTLHIIDLKYGKGVKVEAPGNPQLRLYALGALAFYDDFYDIQKVKVHIFQPRMDNFSTDEITVADLMKWGWNEVVPTAEKAFKGTGEATPGEHCLFCKVKGNCKARAELDAKIYQKNKELDGYLLTNEEVAEILQHTKEIKKWCEDVEAFALEEALKGESYPGWKVVEGRSRRTISDPAGLMAILTKEGFTEDQYLKPKELQTIGNLEKLVGKKHLAEIEGGCITKPPGAPTLAPESDKRPAINSAADDFKEDIKDA